MEEHEIKIGRKNPFKRLNELPNGLVSASAYEEGCKALVWDVTNILRSAVVNPSNKSGVEE